MCSGFSVCWASGNPKGKTTMKTTEQLERLHAMLTHAVTGDRAAFDSAASFGEVDPAAADLLWKAGRAVALSGST